MSRHQTAASVSKRKRSDTNNCPSRDNGEGSEQEEQVAVAEDDSATKVVEVPLLLGKRFHTWLEVLHFLSEHEKETFQVSNALIFAHNCVFFTRGICRSSAVGRKRR